MGRVAAEWCERVADLVAAQRTPLGTVYRPDFSSPSTHLLYGHRACFARGGRAGSAEWTAILAPATNQYFAEFVRHFRPVAEVVGF